MIRLGGITDCFYESRRALKVGVYGAPHDVGLARPLKRFNLLQGVSVDRRFAFCIWRCRIVMGRRDVSMAEQKGTTVAV